jgi:hypothetical protein
VLLVPNAAPRVRSRSTAAALWDGEDMGVRAALKLNSNLASNAGLSNLIDPDQFGPIDFGSFWGGTRVELESFSREALQFVGRVT